MIKKKSGTKPCIQDSNQNCILTRSIFLDNNNIQWYPGGVLSALHEQRGCNSAPSLFTCRTLSQLIIQPCLVRCKLKIICKSSLQHIAYV